MESRWATRWRDWEYRWNFLNGNESFRVFPIRLPSFLFSCIKGGHTNNKITVRPPEVRSIADDLDILVAFDQETIDVNYKELTVSSIILADAKFNPKNPEDCVAPLYAVPFTEIAAELGTSLMKNMVAIGATAALLNLD